MSDIKRTDEHKNTSKKISLILCPYVLMSFLLAQNDVNYQIHIGNINTASAINISIGIIG